jgi:hypothetical protein
VTRRVHGPAGVVDLDSVETNLRRRIAGAGLTVTLADGHTTVVVPTDGVAPVKLPLMFIAGNRARRELGHHGAEPAGVLTAVRIGDGGLIQVEGRVIDDGIPAGTYPCGVDLSNVTGQAVSSITGEKLTDTEWLQIMGAAEGEGPDVVEVTIASRLIAVTMYEPDSGLLPAFPLAQLTVEDR